MTLAREVHGDAYLPAGLCKFMQFSGWFFNVDRDCGRLRRVITCLPCFDLMYFEGNFSCVNLVWSRYENYQNVVQ